MNKLLRMKIKLLLIAIVAALTATSQKTPDKIYGQLFTDIQNSTVFADSKTFVDCTPKRSPNAIVADYLRIKNNLAVKFSLQNFVEENFTIPLPPVAYDNVKKEENVVMHIKNLWQVLKRDKDKFVNGTSLLPLPKSYIVPGGRFREIYYWDSYFTMLGLKESGEVQLIENMIDNFAYLINTYGHVPNGNRSYYISRSQPPFFCLMVELLAEIKGKQIYKKYLPALEKEYAYWMEGANTLKKGQAYKRVVKLNDGTILNRYWDELDIPRQEGYKEDVKTAEEAVANKMMTMKFGSEKAMNDFISKESKNIYKNLRAGAASGWDFSSRWFAESSKISTIQVLDIAPVDLNCLILKLEQVILRGKNKSASNTSIARTTAIKKTFWNKDLNYYTDYNFSTKQPTNVITAAGMYPFYFLNDHPDTQYYTGEKAAKTLREVLLKDGGIQSTNNNTGQQWDAPNGWAPQQWMAIMALENCNQKALAKDIATRWVNVNKKIYATTGKLMEKYNVVDMNAENGGGEYPSQDGFGWTNGVYLALVKKYGF